MTGILTGLTPGSPELLRAAIRKTKTLTSKPLFVEFPSLDNDIFLTPRRCAAPSISPSSRPSRRRPTRNTPESSSRKESRLLRLLEDRKRNRLLLSTSNTASTSSTRLPYALRSSPPRGVDVNVIYSQFDTPNQPSNSASTVFQSTDSNAQVILVEMRSEDYSFSPSPRRNSTFRTSPLEESEMEGDWRLLSL